MYFENEIIKITNNKQSSIFVDMDGVITDYNFGNKLEFFNKRPLFTNISTLKRISELSNINLYILSICKKIEEIDDKNNWLDKYAPFFEKDKRIIIAKSQFSNLSSKELKGMYLNKHLNIIKDEIIIVIDDDNDILKYLKSKFNNIKFYQDSSLID